MHELSVARSLAEFVCEQIAEMDLTHERVALVRIRMGELCGVPVVALKTAFSAVIIGTPLQNCRLEVEVVEPVVFCPHCHREQEIASLKELKCPVCGARTPKVVRGRELEIASIEMREVGEAGANLVG
ncbi:MAG TPA: hydrogenase maturation nickel metallochaperone HypA [Tepidisphaeraceae bacterium]|nr:hydrogenase maturation nickel metallochaperone HypA [Tepidisphaeraceae bacterium]